MKVAPVALTTVGLGLVYFGVSDVRVVDGLRSILKGEIPTPGAILTPSGGGARPAGMTDEEYSAFLKSYTAAPGGPSTPLKLSNVKPHVLIAGGELKTKFGIKTVGGYRLAPCSYGSEHGCGRALDFMTNNIGDPKSVHPSGSALAAYAYANRDRLQILGIIWNRKSTGWTKGFGEWRDYSGASPHTDHVHISFKEAKSVAKSVTTTTPAGTTIPDWYGSKP